jgi:dipeptidyl aminopeptidase/acylaminoacyl peptidase
MWYSSESGLSRALPVRPARGLLLLACALLWSTGAATERVAFRPTTEEVRRSYQQADDLRSQYESRAFKLRLEANWFPDSRGFWYRNDLPGGVREFVEVEAATARKTPAFDHARLAKALSAAASREVNPARLPFREITFEDEGKTLAFEAFGKGWRCNLATYELRDVEIEPSTPPSPAPPWVQDLYAAQRGRSESPDKAWSARIVDHNVRVRQGTGEEITLTENGKADAYYSRLNWSPDSKRIVAVRVMPGDRGQVHMIESSPRGGGRARLHTRVYDQPGDKVDNFDIWLLDLETQESKPVQADLVDYWNLPNIRWRSDGRHFTYEKLDRGYGRWRVIEVDSVTGTTRTLIDENPDTFFDTTARFIHYCRDSSDFIWRSERDGWAHLYRADGDGKILHQLTKGEWVVRSVVRVDEAAKHVVFRASGVVPGEDPYLIRYYRVNFDGTGLTNLTPGHGSHTVQFSPNGQYIVDTYSRVDEPPVHELRRTSDGSLVGELERADVTALERFGWNGPEVFVSKARDGKTDIWGIVFRPRNFDPQKSYPIIEDIYAGPQDSFVPKTFAAHRSMQSLAELGFIVVKIDGMGTRNRSKAFHDVAYQNLGDAGLPDRILWMKALAEKYPYMDTSRVGVFGTSAGGQSSTGAVLFHPEFYKVAVSSCGCHDNRVDKIWWNEQWMGLMGPHYEEQSNVTNAHKLQGKLLLIVGEMDTNVPPESTLRVADALIRARKDFDLLFVPGMGHSSGGAYGERRRRDYFVRHLHGVETPDWNAVPD